MRTCETVERLPGANIPATSGMLAAVRQDNVAPAIRRAGGVIRDAMMLLGIVLSIPFVIVCIGLPIVLVVQLLLWIGGLL